MPYLFMINQYKSSSDQLTISFSTNQYSYRFSSEKAPEGLLETKGVLEFTGLVNGRDFVIESNEIIVSGRANVIATLNLLLSRKDFFRYNERGEMGTYDYWCKRTTSLAVEAICDKSLTQGDGEKIKPITMACLDASFENLKKEALYKTISSDIDFEYGGDLLHHPLYQAISLLKDDHVRRAAEYKALPWLKRMKADAPNDAGYQAIYNGFGVVVPSVYKTKKNTEWGVASEIDSSKIRASRQVATYNRALKY